MSSSASRASARRRGGAPHLQVVRRGSRKLIVRRGSRRAAPYVIGGAILVLGIVFTVLLEQVVLAQSAFKLNGLQKKLVAAEMHHQELLLEVNRLESSDRIERFAREELGMVDSDPAAADYIYADISDDSPAPLGRRLVDGDGESGGAAVGTFSGEGLSP